ncbi:MAG: sigma-70 family RNA polymerase sigma factor [Verrucomicrobiaceae bacterium]|nr:sigma-70 family RNA polymerase sigma factor [Verrucomicrobiaceae bacterium]
MEQERQPARSDVSAIALLPEVYDDLRKLARGMVAREGLQTLTATALVHEAWLKVSKDDESKWESRRHFFGAAAQAMRRILLNRYRDKQRLKRGGAHEHVSAEELPVAAPVPDEQIESLDEALTRLAAAEPLVAEIVNLRWFAGLKWSEIADVTGVPERELNRLWVFARAWLKTEIE